MTHIEFMEESKKKDKAIKDLIKAWNFLDEGYHSSEVVADWLKIHMAPAIKKLRKLKLEL